MDLSSAKPLIEAVLLAASAYFLAMFFAQVALVSAMSIAHKSAKSSIPTVTLNLSVLFFVLWLAIQ